MELVHAMRGLMLNSDSLLPKSMIVHYSDVIMSEMVSQITSLAIVCQPVYSGADQSKHQSSVSRAFVRGIHRWPVNSPHKGPVTRKMFYLMTSSCRAHWNICITMPQLIQLLQTLIHRSPVNSPHKGQWPGTLIFYLICTLNKRLRIQSWGWWFETPWHSLWRHCNVWGIFL